MKSLCLYLSLAFWACHPQREANKDTELPDFVPLECPPQIIIVDRLSGGPIEWINGVQTPLPDSYKDAEQGFAEAVAKFADHKFVDAARGFLIVAQRIDDAARDFLVVERMHEDSRGHAESFRRDRILAYEYAAFAYENAKVFDEGRRELTQRAHQDPVCAAELERIVRDLNDWERHCKPVQ